MRRHRHIPSLRAVMRTTLAAFGLLVACGDGRSDPPPPPGVVVQPIVRSTEPAIATIQAYIDRNQQAKRPDKSKPEWRLETPMRPKVTFSATKAYVWTLETEFGPIQIKLRTDTAPEHAANAIYLTLLGFYDGLSIYRIAPGKALETGDPADDGKGGPQYAFSPETRTAKHDRRGLVSAVSLGDSTDDSKFRITFAADPTILPISTIFGDVENGFDALKKLEELGTPEGRPKRHVTIRRATISIR